MSYCHPIGYVRMTLGHSIVNRYSAVAGGKIRLEMSTKNTRLTFRVRSELKKKLELVAASESRSVAQICEAFLHAGLVAYDKEGAKYISHFLVLRDAPLRDR
jgi:hypothetical protein